MTDRSGSRTVKTLLQLMAGVLAVESGIAMSADHSMASPWGILCLAGALAFGFAAVQRAQPERRKGTVTESALLVGLSFLVSIVWFPLVLQDSKAGARTTCLSSLKQLFVATVMYRTDYDDRLPSSPQWRTGLKDYLPMDGNATTAKSRQLRCPLTSEPWTYAMNAALSRVRIEDVAEPAGTVQLFDSGGKVPNLAGGPEMFAPRHAGLGTVAFSDGHTQLCPRDGLHWTAAAPRSE